MRLRTLRSSGGFTYIAALVMVVIMGIMWGQAATVWKTKSRREKEVELLFRGAQIRTAMQRYYGYKQAPPGTLQPPQTQPARPNPKELKDLELDPSSTEKKRYLRRAMEIDPITGKDWDWVMDGGQRIGVKSTSNAEPIKQANFPDDFIAFEGKKKYSEWEFVYNRVPPLPGAKAGSQTGAGIPVPPVPPIPSGTK
jgi:type II secretory pathway pseudopilin PulG